MSREPSRSTHNWTLHQIRDLIADKYIVIGDGYRAKNSELSAQGIPFVRAGNIDKGFHFDDAECFPIKDLSKVGNKISRPFDTVFTSKGTVGRFAYVNHDTPRFVYSPQLCFWRCLENSIIDSRFLFFWMHGPEFWEQASSVKGQTDMADYVNLSDQRNMKITLPPLPEQRAIAGVLSSLDDKIDLLNRQNKTLEGMAEAVFREKFIENPLPHWQEQGLDEIAAFLNGLPCQKYLPDAFSQALPVIKIKELRTGTNEDSDLATANVPPEYIIKDGDILFSWSGSLEIVIWSFGKGVLNQHLFKVTSVKYPKWFYYFWIKHHLSEFRDIAEDKATTMGHIQRHHLSDALVLIPDKNSFEILNNTVNPLFNKMTHNLIALRKLAHLRDALLPKLMSGKIRVKP